MNTSEAPAGSEMALRDSQEESEAFHRISPAELTLLVSVFTVAACGLVYELAAGALASLLMGDSILQFSTIIGTYLFAMGIGSWLSRLIERQLVAQFLRIELLVGLFGGLMPAGLFAAFTSLPVSSSSPFKVLLYAWVLLIGILVGLEIPIVMRILKKQFSHRYALKDLVAEVLTFDYLGALMVSLAFPLLLLPHLGLVRAGVFFGLMNALVAAWTLWLFRGHVRRFKTHAIACWMVVGLLLVAMLESDRLTRWSDDRFYGNAIIVNQQTPYQKIVVTHQGNVTRLFLNGNLQFNSSDEYRYHEALVHPAMAATVAPRRVLVLGGGDGMATREILKHHSVEQVTLVELDPEMTTLFKDDERLAQLNHGALRSPKVHVVNKDAFTWLDTHQDMFDVIIVDFPDPTNFSVGKLYTTAFYRLLSSHLSESGYLVIQTTSPLIARESFWTVASTVEAVGLNIAPYHAHVPSFGEWGFILAGHRPFNLQAASQHLPEHLSFLTAKSLPLLFDFPPDMARIPEEPNTLSQQRLVTLFEQEWGRAR